ncbi:MAG TPA: galactose-1-epimerase [Bacteroidales bacterium]|nr:MAG: galactose mutarotase [Bacteroidetes bacterium GWE2_42_24]OFY25355.1 MAG: galactose mutarotase [Bacteroidetes bacterium GWF2_43_11]HAQ64319.1 galactose-1-epimerase [Bacteroidales bacterium]HBZ67639.1 galactose-1-epimerase [Bacteroidales bacterium]
MFKQTSLFLLMVAAFTGCNSKPEKTDDSMIPADSMKQYVIVNKNGMKAVISNYGAKLVSLYVPDRTGVPGDVVLGFDSLPEYLTGEKYFGAIVGRYANRIGAGNFTLDGHKYQLPLNNGKNHLHGGDTGFHSRLWNVMMADSTGITLVYTSPDGENGYPGTLMAEVSYTLTDNNTLYIHYNATTDKPTIVNLTHHSFFNLKDGGHSSILDHVLTIYASHFTPIDEGLIPTGELAPVEGTPFDFTKGRRIGERIDETNSQLAAGKGYDHNFILDRPESKDSLWIAASVFEPESGRFMEVLTTEPGLQFYSGNFLDGSQVGKGKVPYQFRTAFCLETQHFPDSPNKPEFPSVVLRPGETYRQVTAYRFSVR